MRNLILGLTIATGMALAGAQGMPASDDDSTRAADKAAQSGLPIRVFAPVADRPGVEQSRSPLVPVLTTYFKHLPMEVRLERLPVRRAFQQYSRSAFGCLLDRRDRARDKGELVSNLMIRSRFWLYARKGSVPATSDALRRIGTIMGAEFFINEGAHPDIDWVYVPTYQALISMLQSGRVDAATLGPHVTQGVIPLPDGIERVSEEPFLTLELVMRCKNTPETAAFIAEINDSWGDIIDNN